MFINGSLKIKDPELEKKELYFEKINQATDFTLELDRAGKKKIGFDVWFDASDDKVLLITDIAEDEIIYENVLIGLKDGQENSVAISVSYEQAKAIKEIIDAYINARGAYEAAVVLRERETIV